MRQVVISGVSRGLGFELLDLLIKGGQRPVAIGRRTDPRHNSEISNGAFTFLAADLADANSLEQLDFRHVFPEATSQIVFISNAGTVDPISLLENVGAPALSAAFATNALGPIFIVKKLLQISDARRIQLRIINISTGAARKPFPGLGAYCASKAAASMLLDCLAKERPDVDVRHVDPGVFDTDMQLALRSAPEGRLPVRNVFERFAAEGRLRKVRDVAHDLLVRGELL